MIIGKVVGQDVSQMPLVQDDDMIQTLPPDTPDEPFNIGILPRTPWRNEDLLDAHMLDPLSKGCAIDTVPTAEQILWGLVPRERLNHLLCRPWGGRMLGNVEMHDATAVVRQNHEYEKHPERHRRYDKKV